jgi:osmotically-inducible protein OsmY
MKRMLIVLLSLLLVSSAFATQNSNTRATMKPKAEKAAPVDCANNDDATITANVKDKLSKTASLKEATINVDTKDGVVTLTGNVKMGRNKGLATLQTRRVPCVKKVDNKLSVEQSKDKAMKNNNSKVK